MKKILSILTVILVAVFANADLTVDLRNGDPAAPKHNTLVVVKDGTLSPAGFTDGVLAQLIWTASVPTAQAGDGGSLGDGEFLLNSVLTLAGPGTYKTGNVVYYDSNVGGADINNGYIFVRIFDNNVKAVDDYYLQFNYYGSALSDTAGDPPGTPYDMNANQVTGFLAVNDSAYGHQIIPEPAVASLLVVFGGGLMFAKRRFAKA